MQNRNISSEQNAPVHKIGELFNKALKKRHSINSNALRLINGTGDGLPGLTLDQYNKHYVLQIFDKTLANRADYIGQRFLEYIDADYFIVKMRCWSDGLSLEDAPVSIIRGNNSSTVVTENGIQFAVDVHDAINTGLFLDMRSNRKMVTKGAKGKSILNGFAYTCSFGLYARYFGAVKSVNVDISQKILDIGRENYTLNNIPANDDEFVRADVVTFLELAQKQDNLYDIIVMDPPSFSRHKGKTFSVKKSMEYITELSIPLLKPAGELFLSTNNSTITNSALLNIIENSCRSQSATITSHSKIGQDIDFPGSGKVRESHLSGIWAKISKNY